MKEELIYFVCDIRLINPLCMESNPLVFAAKNKNKNKKKDL